MKTLKEFEQWFDKAQKDKEEQYPFVWELEKSPFVEYHYSLMKDKSLDEEFRNSLWYSFDEHREEAATLLLSKLDSNQDTDFYANIIFCLGRIADEHRIEKERILEWSRKLTDSPDDYVRNRAIIVMGWIGQIKDIPLLANHLLNDTDAKCRTWSATSFMQMYFRQKRQSLVDKALPYLKQAISQETDYFALGCMIDVVKELTGKKFGLPQYAIDNEDKEKIDIAKLKVERFFKKLYKE